MASLYLPTILPNDPSQLWCGDGTRKRERVTAGEIEMERVCRILTHKQSFSVSVSKRCDLCISIYLLSVSPSLCLPQKKVIAFQNKRKNNVHSVYYAISALHQCGSLCKCRACFIYLSPSQPQKLVRHNVKWATHLHQLYVHVLPK